MELNVKISLVDIDKNNYREVMSLEVESGQEQFVAPNSESIAESKFNQYCRPRAICLGEEIIGFAMYV
ncbi:GNAT family N-acetyltransferase [Xenorhabdus stockiae]|uniref:GNAT family N-acetyltransferase n=1 Tax=Xenorhabdus stockiae TaxID=351614 RepID=A0A2D0KRJ1_9GAMM|nr:GNAT family N-acetyltransferase [Xenorhabdus stockiae]